MALAKVTLTRRPMSFYFGSSTTVALQFTLQRGGRPEGDMSWQIPDPSALEWRHHRANLGLLHAYVAHYQWCTTDRSKINFTHITTQGVNYVKQVKIILSLMPVSRSVGFAT